MRLSDKCYRDSCDKPHHRIASHIDSEGHRHYFCGLEHQLEHLNEKRQQRLQRREHAARMTGA